MYLREDKESYFKKVLFAGLRSELSLRSAYKNDITDDYDKFKLELRKMENDIRIEQVEIKKCSVASALNTDKPKSEIGELKTLLEQLNSRIDKIEKEKEELREQLNRQSRNPTQPINLNFNRGFGGRKRYRRGYRGQGRGRGQYEPQRPLAGNTLAPRKCYICDSTEHLKKDCSMNKNDPKA